MSRWFGSRSFVPRGLTTGRELDIFFIALPDGRPLSLPSGGNIENRPGTRHAPYTCVTFYGRRNRDGMRRKVKQRCGDQAVRCDVFRKPIAGIALGPLTDSTRLTTLKPSECIVKPSNNYKRVHGYFFK